MKGFVFNAIQWLCLLVSPMAIAGELSYPGLLQLIQNKSIHSIDQLLPALPKDYRSFYTFVYQSRSLQAEHTSPLLPRAILYGSDAKLIMTFTQASRGTADDTVEIMSWSDRTERFTLYELSFDRQGRAQTSEPNPAKCVRCHGDPVRPVFDPYRMWAGSYGSLSAGGKDWIGKGTKEFAYYADFIRRARYTGRYAALPRERVAYRDAFEGGDVNVTNAEVKDPNADLTLKLIQLNDRRVARWILESPAFPAFKYAIKALNDGCYKNVSVEQYFPPAVRGAGLGYEALRQDTLGRIDAQFNARAQRLKELNSVDDIPIKNFALQAEALRKITRFRYILERMGLDPALSRIALDNGDFDLSDGKQRINEVHHIEIADRVSRIAEDADSRLDDMDCEELRRTSYRQFGETAPTRPQTTPDEVQLQGIRLLQSACLDCHGGGSSIPMMPFASEQALREQLARDPGLAGRLRDRLLGRGGAQMPLGQPLPRATADQLIRYIDSLR